MVTLLPPAIVCTPAIPFDDDWHDANRVMYNPENKTAPLIYYQPVLLYGGGIKVGVKGKIANYRSKEAEKAGPLHRDDTIVCVICQKKVVIGEVRPVMNELL